MRAARGVSGGEWDVSNSACGSMAVGLFQEAAGDGRAGTGSVHAVVRMLPPPMLMLGHQA